MSGISTWLVGRVGVCLLALLLAACGGGADPAGRTQGPPAQPDPPASNAAPVAGRLVQLSSAASGQLVASWLPATDDSTPSAELSYELHASTEAGFAPSASTLLFSEVGATAATVSGLTGGVRYTVRVAAVDAQGARGVSEALQIFISDTDPAQPTPNGLVMLEPGRIIAVDATSLTIAAGGPVPAIGQYLLSTEGEGLLRKVAGVSNSQSGTVVATQFASLAEVARDVRIATTLVLPPSPSVTGQAVPPGAGLQAAHGEGRDEYRWLSSQFMLSYPAATERAGTKRVLEANISVSSSEAEGGFGRWTRWAAPQDVAILTGTTGRLELRSTVVDDDLTQAAVPQRIPTAICRVELYDNPLPAAIRVATRQALSVQDVMTPTGLFQATRQALDVLTLDMTAVAARAEPYIVGVRLYVDEAQNRCAEVAGRGLLGWKEVLDVQVKVLVASTAGFPQVERRALRFEGGLSVENNLKVDFVPAFEAVADIRGYKLDRAHFEVKGRAELEHVLRVTATGAATLDKTLPAISERRFVHLLPTTPPVVVSGTFSADLRVQGRVDGRLTATQTARLAIEGLSYGFVYDSGNWTTIASARPTHSLTLSGEGDAEARLTLTLLPKFTLKIYETVGARLALAPSMTAQAGMHGQVVRGVVDGATYADNDYWLTKGHLSVGVDAYLMGDLTVLDHTLLAWPSGADPSNLDSFRKLTLVGATPVIGLPALSATADVQRRNAEDSRAFLFRGAFTEVPNPLQATFGGPDTFLRFVAWTAPTVIAADDTGYQLLAPPPDAKPGDFWIAFTKPGTYVVRLSGYSALGAWARQVVETTLVLTDHNHNGIIDQWEAKYGLTGDAQAMAQADPDGDGLSNLEEFLVGSDPHVRPGPVPTIRVAVDDVGPVTGEVPLGGRTDDRRPVLIGSLSEDLAPGHVVRIYDGSVLLPTVAVTPSYRSFSFSVPQPLSYGTHTFRAVVMDAEGRTLTRGKAWWLIVADGPVVQMVSNDLHDCVLTDEGAVKCWGWSLGDGGAYESIYGPVSFEPVIPTGLEAGVASLSAAHYRTCANLVNGAVKCWPVDWPMMGFPPPYGPVPNLPVVLPFANGEPATPVWDGLCTTSREGALNCYGVNNVVALAGTGAASIDRYVMGQPKPPPVAGLNGGVVSVGIGQYHACALKEAGSVLCWGSDVHGGLGKGPYDEATGPLQALPVTPIGLSAEVTALAVSRYSNCVLVEQRVKCWGVLAGTPPQDVPARPWHDRVHVVVDVPTEIPGLPDDVVSIGVVDVGGCALTSRGGVKCWGLATILGNGSQSSSWTAVDVTGLTESVVQISMGAGRACALTATAAVLCWGDVPGRAYHTTGTPLLVQQFHRRP